MTQATVALDLFGPYGYVVQYPGAYNVLHGEFKDHLPFLDAIDVLLQNGFTWKVLIAGPSDGPVAGALWYLAAKNGAEFHEVPAPVGVTDGMLTKAGLWRRGMSGANRAARLLYEGPATP